MAGIFFTVLSAVILASAYLGSPLGVVSFVALVPFFHSVYSTGKKNSFRLGFFWGLAFFGPVLWWIAPTISTYGRLPLWAAWIVFAALVCYLALYPAIWALLARWILPEKRDISCLGVLSLSSLWILLEFLRGTILSGFPWGSLAYSLCRIPLLIQSAALVGPYGVGFMIMFMNLALWQLILALENRDFFRINKVCICRCTAVAVAAAASTMIYGRHVLSAHEKGEVRVAAIQGSFDQSVKWDPSYRLATLERYKTLTSKAKEELPDLKLAVWPETAMPFYFQEEGRLRQEVTGLAKALDISILFGSPSYYYDKQGKIHYRNSSFLVGPDGSFRGRYDKLHLVPFGEYMPWGILTAWAREFLPTAGDFSAGTSAAPLKSNPFRIGVMICFESIFPEISREEVLSGANLLAVITNDAWFGRTAAPFQHADMAVFRAVETGRWIVRAANTGISRIISPRGEVAAESRLFQPCFISGLVSLRTNDTLYSRYGPSWFLAVNLLFILLNYFYQGKRWRKGHGQH